MFTDSFLTVIGMDGLVSLVIMVNNEPYVAMAWNSDIVTTHDGRFLIPITTVEDSADLILHSNVVLLTVGSKEVDGRNGVGCGFLIKGRANSLSTGAEWDMMTARFSVSICVLEVVITSIKQTL
jgi:hypothetical protein